MDSSLDGVLLVNKPKGKVSHDVVLHLRKMKPGVKIGHLGTLDPLASGLLPVMFGKANRLHRYLTAGKKRYTGSIFLGQNRDTYDADGEPTSELSEVNLNRKDIEEVISGFEGIFLQSPPPYSAIKIHGKPVYKLARAGEKPRLKKRTVDIYSIDVLDLVNNILKIKVFCSPGTYIRSLAYDIGKELECGAYLQDLTREASGEFSLSDAIDLDVINHNNLKNKYLDGCLIPLERLLPNFSGFNIKSDRSSFLFSSGNSISAESGEIIPPSEDKTDLYIDEATESVRVYYREKLLGIGYITSNRQIRPVTVLQ